MQTKYASRFSRPSPYDKVNFFSKVVFTYIFSTFYRGWRNNGLQMDDLYQCPKDDEADKITKKLLRNWDIETKKKNPSIGWTMFRTYASGYVVPLIVYLVLECAIRIVQPIMLGKVINYFTGQGDITRKWAWLYAGGVCLTALICNSLIHPSFMQVMRMGMRCRTACCMLMYQKALKLSLASMGQTAVGQIVNIMSNDVNRFDEFSIFACYMIVAPIQTAIVIYIVWTHLGVSSFVGLVILLLFIPFQLYMGELFSKIRSSIATLTDTRLRYMNEIISGMRVIKMYSWENPFAERVANARKSEVSRVKRACYLRGLNLSIFFVASRIILFAMFITYVLLGNPLSADGVFVSVALFNSLRISITLLFPNAISLMGELKISCRRIQEFLLLGEISNNNSLLNNVVNEKGIVKAKDSHNQGQAYVKVDHITARWNSQNMQPTLKDISVDLKPGDLLAVIGPVGSGKSSFLMSLLNELPLEAGSIDINGSSAYSSQDAWSFNDSVRNNILFGTEYDEKRYQKVVEVCALERDLKLMPHSDRTLVGEKSASLSGGQKARINLARAVYRGTDIYLFDDPLSAVDTAVAEHIFEKCIMEHLCSKIRILVTHQIQFIQKATKILVLKDGKCLAYGSFTELQSMEIDFMSLLKESEEKEDPNRERSMSEISSERSNSVISNEALKGRPRTLSIAQVEAIQLDSDKPEEMFEDLKVEEEQFQRGSLNAKVYLEYSRAGGGIVLWSSMILFTLVSQVVFHWSDIYLTDWTNKNQAEGKPEQSEQNKDIYIFTAMIVVLFISTIFRSVTFFAICMNASVRLHKKIFSRLLRAPVAFFDTNPAGRILNRFTKDLGIIDEALPKTAYDLNLTIAQAIGIVITVSLVNWYLALPAIGLTVVILLIRGIYIKSARDIKRYEGLVRSPVYSHVNNTVNGLASIRAYGAQRPFELQFNANLNDHTSTWFWYLSSARAMGQVLDWLTTVYIVIITVSVMMTDGLQGGDAGLAISSGLMLAGMTQWGIIQSAEFESQMTSVERIVEYQDLEQEAPAESKKGLTPESNWPESGEIEFDHMNLAYGKNMEKPVLKNISCTIYGGEKIGIVGRTGAGKSSMIAALFRLTEPNGAIRIDGIDIQTIGLDDLRKKVSIIPQDPVVFSGSVRYNLDPFKEYQDDALWSALEEVQLKKQVENFDGNLEAKLSDNGGNLSVGQRQLICLARAVLRRNRVLILDEATANVDHQTDSLIQKTIRSEFASCTVMTIAHRLNTIIDCDRVLVLDAGEILEFDSPYQLLKNRHVFYDMCKKTGDNMFAQLQKIAKITHHKKSEQMPTKESTLI